MAAVVEYYCSLQISRIETIDDYDIVFHRASYGEMRGLTSTVVQRGVCTDAPGLLD